MPVLRVKADDGKWYDIPCIIGKDGHTPVKGVDYWTAADRGEIENAVLASIPCATVDNAGIVQLSDSVESDSSTTAATSKAVKLAYDYADQVHDCINSFLYRVRYKFENVSIPYFGYALLGHMSVFGLDATTDFIVSLSICGWSSGDTGKGCISVAKSTDGSTIYLLGSDECVFPSVTVEIIYTKVAMG